MLRSKYNLERWDRICLERVFTWAGHVARFGKYSQDRIAWQVLQFRGIAYLRQLEKSYGQQCHESGYGPGAVGRSERVLADTTTSEVGLRSGLALVRRACTRVAADLRVSSVTDRQTDRQ
eukprot:2973216-Pyramimonas_sp.AAC.1